MKAETEPALGVRCPTCGAKPRERCELNNGFPRTYSHQAREAAAEKRRPSAIGRRQRIALPFLRLAILGES